MVNEFFTIKEPILSEFVEKKSRFIANVFRVNSENEANEKITEVKKLHRDAKHNVFAYRIANGVERFSDDGEPSGTAGVPILDILRGENLENILVVVTRYFGGILLGTGGLVRAYSEVTKNALLSSDKIKLKLCTEYELEFDYSILDILNHYFKKNNITSKSVLYNEKIVMKIIVEKSLEESILKEIEEISSRNVLIKLIDTYYFI